MNGMNVMNEGMKYECRMNVMKRVKKPNDRRAEPMPAATITVSFMRLAQFNSFNEMRLNGMHAMNVL